MIRLSALVLLMATIVATAPAAAETITADPAGFTVRTTRDIAAPPVRVHTALVEDVGRWWHPDHTFGGDASRLFIEPRAGGIFGENLPGGGSVRHLDVLYVDPGRMLRLGGGLGPLQGMAVNGAMTFELQPVENGTRLALTYTVGGWTPDGLENLAGPVDGVLAQQMDRLKEYVER